eukprot:TRINITY_DN3033_c0_g1_i1.p1 TRINITY_DN3033_c0_g1~~TRINITY_DN3033_c0_g1_i1.p1  ORF type:complete len:1080 (-),score=122.26 TRINITY_DN3033_c0_g1_i1:24-2777(-)
MEKNHATLFTGATLSTFGIALNASLELMQGSPEPNIYVNNQQSRALIGSTVVWDITSNELIPVDDLPGTWMAMRPSVAFRRSQNDLVAVCGNILDGVQHVHRLNFSTPCLGCDSSNGDCVLGVYCRCNDPNSPARNCSVRCNDCVHGQCVPTQIWNVPTTGMCICERGWNGERCDQPFKCDHGYLNYINQTDPLGPQQCSCHNPWLGADCDHTCIKGFSCYGDAICSNDTCQCPGHFTGPHCEYDLALPELFMYVCYDQNWGRSTQDLTGLTWCRSDNPTISPLRLPPPADPNSIAFDVRPCANESNSNATCKTVVKVSSLGWTQAGEPYSFVLSGMLDGHFIVASFTNDSIAGRFKLGDSPVNHIVGSVCSAGGLVLASDNDKFLTLLLLPNGTTHTIAAGEWLLSPGYAIAQVDLLAYDYGGASMAYPLALMKKVDPKVSGPEWMMQLREYQFNASRPSIDAHMRNWIFWRISNNVTGDLRFELAPQPEGFELFPGASAVNLNVLRPVCSSWNAGRPSRIIAMLSDATKVSVIGLPSFPLPSSGDFEINMTQSIVFEASPYEEIVKADLYPECFSVPTALSSAMLVSITVKHLRIPGGNFYVVRLDEFARHSAYCAPPALPDNLLRNLLVYRQPDSSCVEVSISKCPVGSYFDGNSCVLRSSTSRALSFVPSDSFVRFIGPPTGKLTPDDLMNTFHSNKWNTSLTSMMGYFMYHAHFFLDDSRQSLELWAVQQDIRNITDHRTTVRRLNTFHTSSPVESWHVTDNGQHILVASNRKKWELEAQERLVEICHERKVNTTAEKLYSSFAPLCETPFGEPKPVSYSDFVFMLSMCSRETYCPSFGDIPRSFVTTVTASAAPDGKYAIAPGLLKECEKGYFCRNGQRRICPRGFVCPAAKTITPTLCETILGLNNQTYF